MPGKNPNFAEEECADGLKRSNDMNMSALMALQFKLIIEKIDDQGEKVSKMYNWLINDPETGDYGVVKTVKRNSERVGVLETNDLIRKREVRLITIIGGAIYTVINLVLKYI